MYSFYKSLKPFTSYGKKYVKVLTIQSCASTTTIENSPSMSLKNLSLLTKPTLNGKKGTEYTPKQNVLQLNVKKKLLEQIYMAKKVLF